MIEVALALLCIGTAMMAINGASTYLIYLAEALILGTALFIFTKHLKPELERRKINKLLEESKKYDKFIKESEVKYEIK